MTKKIFSALLPLTLVALYSSHVLADADQDFSKLLNQHWQNAEQEKVFFRTDPDGWKPDAKLADWTPKAMARRDAFNTQMLKQLASIDIKQLSTDNQMSYRLFVYERNTEKASYLSADKYFPINFLSGWHTYFAEAPANMAFLNAGDYDKFLVSLADYPRFNQENINLLKDGVKQGFVHYCGSFKNYGETIKEHIVANPKDSALFEPFTRFPKQFTERQITHYRSKAEQLLKDAVIPAYQDFYDYFQHSYMSKCRTEAGIGSVKGGDEYYEYTANYYTTTTLTPKEIHELGLSEVARIQQEMNAIIQQLNFKGTQAEFLQFLATDPQFFAIDRQDVLEKTAFITQKMYGKLPFWFSHLPRNTFTIKGSAARGAFYMPPPDNRTPGTYFLSSDPKQQPLYNLEALSLHEGVPGHHLQNAIAQELDVPEFRRTLNHSAFAEGWGLYSERLGKEAGFYESPYSDFGRLGYEMWRAVRLVVDTGIHAFGWTREQAVEYLASHTALTDKSVNDQIDRYISWPGQALSYKIGEIKIRQLRAKAEQELGRKFDIRQFHDTVIGQGSLPMDVLDDVINEWISQQQAVANH
ncbi:DUF885 domain-containing protein [Paraglaciecola hydrolytica]|uniref:DUF885 domain-containing protein n=1 Tax=Paraglaciecola hydrolytica TaxID=1799789 RepID=A0A148KME3_9ALTE|nr:DUF885 domain-containing protein [Paraglaciecola hydrolytica]KXI27429.1 hypothetical protein AX660_22195 [Paraglaciecola hydrolytica]